jgi:hypothetical protein
MLFSAEPIVPGVVVPGVGVVLGVPGVAGVPAVPGVPGVAGVVLDGVVPDGTPWSADPVVAHGSGAPVVVVPVAFPPFIGSAVFVSVDDGVGVF